ncbi:hypothetical protein P168DRAFT_300986 [Aspergillus campestris IBT 28561]|uniref:Calcofluor white hypersensitive protein n=1 Tax=Aspergillus campestris (strain IBT 28561) TaxID=1392248 RepID=A0A2I1DEG4_ASPC2|nr:uncharacterized protein P168DRAFT_300986 [Aspergillus campestris IBT 28561]PKY08240.1 hypothetical protein P168DRAFT_300986 [Aspergillus campestris IBT 28561]
MSKSRAPLYGGLAAFAGIGYYLYQAGGDASKAGDKIRVDVDKARHQLPHSEKSAEKAGAELGSNVDKAAKEARARATTDAQEGIHKLDEMRQDATIKTREGIDKLDKSVEEKAAEAKGKVSGWFGK